MRTRIIAYCLLGGLLISAAGLAQPGWMEWVLAGVVLSAAFVPVARFGPRGIAAQFGVIAPVLLIVTLLCTWSEGAIFMPQLGMAQHAAQELGGGSVLWLLTAAVLALLARGLRLQPPDEPPGGPPDGPDAPRPRLRAALPAALLMIVCGLAYTLYYLVFGGLTFHFITYRYYPHAIANVGRLGAWLWVIEIARGILMTLAVLPVLATLRMSRRNAAITLGLLLWIAGGAAPLLLPGVPMVWAQRWAHMAEIFTQNASLGVTAALLLRPRAGTAVAASAPVHAG